MKHTTEKPREYADRLHELRKDRGMSQEELGQLLGVQKTAIYKYEKGLTSIPQNKIAKICDIFGVPADYLLGRSNETPEELRKFIKIKFYDRWTVNGPIQSKIPEIGYEVPKNEAKIVEKNFFAIKFMGDSMYPFYMDGDIVVIEKGVDFNTGEDVLLSIGESDAVIRKCSKEPNGLLIKAINPIFPPKFYTFEELTTIPVNILGRVKQITRKF